MTSIPRAMRFVRRLFRRIVAVLLFAMSGIFAMGTLAIADEPTGTAPSKEHQWLTKFVGQWESHATAQVGPDQPPMDCTGSMTSKMLGGLWVVNRLQSESMGQTVEAIQTLGFDAKKKKYVGTWVDTMISHQWIYEGGVEESGNVLTLYAKGPNFMPGAETSDGKLLRYRDRYQFQSADHIIVTSAVEGEDGSWTEFMRGDMRRK